MYKVMLFVSGKVRSGLFVAPNLSGTDTEVDSKDLGTEKEGCRVPNHEILSACMQKQRRSMTC